LHPRASEGNFNVISLVHGACIREAYVIEKKVLYGIFAYGIVSCRTKTDGGMLKMDEIDAKRLSLKLMATSKAAYLTTIDEKGFPHTRAMTNLRNKIQKPNLTSLFSGHVEDYLILFSTNTSSTKVRHVKSNPKVSVYYSDPEKWQGVMFGGEIEIAADVKLKQAIWDDGMKKYYPGGYDDPDHTVLRLHPRMVKGWDGQRFTTFAFRTS